MTSVSKKTRMSDLIDYRLKVTTVDGRSFVGQLLAFDAHLNLVLTDTEEFRLTKKSLQELKKGNKDAVIEDKRTLGLIILRGDQVVSFSIESAPVLAAKERIKLGKGKGVSKPLTAKGRLSGPMSTKNPFKKS